MSDTDERFSEPDEYGGKPHGRRYVDRHPWTVDRIVITIVAILSVLSLIFSLGVNYQRLSSVDARLARHERDDVETYVRRDVSAAQWESVTYQLQQLRMQVEALTDIVMMQQRTTPQAPPPRPRFR